MSYTSEKIKSHNQLITARHLPAIASYRAYGSILSTLFEKRQLQSSIGMAYRHKEPRYYASPFEMKAVNCANIAVIFALLAYQERIEDCNRLTLGIERLGSGIHAYSVIELRRNLGFARIDLELSEDHAWLPIVHTRHCDSDQLEIIKSNTPDLYTNAVVPGKGNLQGAELLLQCFEDSIAPAPVVRPTLAFA